MKFSTISICIITLIAFTSCQKENLEKEKKGAFEKELAICTWDNTEVEDETVWEEYIIEPIVSAEGCDCITDGVVKYVKTGTDFAYVIYYGKGECDQWAYLVTYHDGDDKKEEKCKFEMDCEGGN